MAPASLGGRTAGSPAHGTTKTRNAMIAQQTKTANPAARLSVDR